MKLDITFSKANKIYTNENKEGSSNASPIHDFTIDEITKYSTQKWLQKDIGRGYVGRNSTYRKHI